MSADALASCILVGGGRGFSKVVDTFNHVGGSFNLYMPPQGVSE